MQEIEVSILQNEQDIGVDISGEQSDIEVLHDNTLKGKGNRSAPLGVADSVLSNIDSKVSDVKVNGETVVEDTVANITIGDATITIQKNGQDVDSFTTNSTTDKVINLSIPTKTSDIRNNSDYQTGTDVANSISEHNTSIDAHNNILSPISRRITNNTTAISNEKTRATTAEGELQSQITVNANNITTINGKIPTQASSDNQLADKRFVNSSISTNTANFIGTFNSVAELEAYSGTVTNNDYAFVIGTDSAGNTVYNRYKYTTATTPASWEFEYALNNSSFTSAQWTAINSGATTENIGQISTNEQDIAINKGTMDAHIANVSNPHQVTKAQVGLGNCDNTSDLDKPVSTAQQTALDGKVDKTTTANQVYTTNGDGEQSHYLLSINATANSFAYRTSSAQVRVATTPSGNNDATSKKYVDDGLATKQGTLTAGTNIQINNDTISATDTTYTGSDGITLTGTNFTNSGVRAVAGGTANGTISVNTNGTSADVAVTGLGSAAYTESTDYATAAQGAKADTAVQPSDLATVATTGEFSDLLNKPTTLSGYGITDGANTDLSNLTSTGANIGNWSSNVTNCITEIPQDIKLELDNGTLTLKAGSKVYVPNGAGVFDEVVKDSDLVYNFGSPANGRYLIFNSQYFYALSNCVSGSSDSKAGQTYHSWYDTTNNLVKQYWADGSTPARTDSLPVAIITVSGGVITSIDQIFNGFGYIGSSVFALPNVKALSPNGRNTDGTCNNIERTVSDVLIMNMESWMAGRTNSPMTIDSNGYLSGMNIDNNNWGSVKYLKDISRIAYACWYCAEDNKMHYFNGNTEESTPTPVFIGSFDVDANNKITAIRPKASFHTLDYSDTDFIAHQAMPSSRYIDLQLLGSGNRYDAPADGWFVASSEGVITMSLVGNRSGITVNGAAGFAPWATLPVSKGAYVLFNYENNQNNKIRFYYAEGTK